MFVALLYVLLKSFYVHMLTGDLANIAQHLQASPNDTGKCRQVHNFEV
jgi:hypothetical protein